MGNLIIMAEIKMASTLGKFKQHASLYALISQTHHENNSFNLKLSENFRPNKF